MFHLHPSVIRIHAKSKISRGKNQQAIQFIDVVAIFVEYFKITPARIHPLSLETVTTAAL